MRDGDGGRWRRRGGGGGVEWRGRGLEGGETHSGDLKGCPFNRNDLIRMNTIQVKSVSLL